MERLQTGKDIRKSVYIRLNDNKGLRADTARPVRQTLPGTILENGEIRGVPPLANGKRIPRTILVHHVSDTSPFDCIVALPSFLRRRRREDAKGLEHSSNSRILRYCKLEFVENRERNHSLSLSFSLSALKLSLSLSLSLKSFTKISFSSQKCRFFDEEGIPAPSKPLQSMKLNYETV